MRSANVFSRLTSIRACVLLEGREVDLPNLIVLGEPHEHADAPHPIALLRLGGERRKCDDSSENDREPDKPDRAPRFEDGCRGV